MITIVGQIADRLGHASTIVTVDYYGPANRNFDVEHDYHATPSTEYRSVQAATIPVDVNHDRVIGTLKYLERNPGGNLYAVCEIDGSSLTEGTWYYSPKIAYRDGGKDIELRSLAVTQSPASVALSPLTAFPGTLADAAREIVYQDGYLGAIAKRAGEYDRKRKHNDPIVIEGDQPRTPTIEPVSTRATVETRSAQVADVSLSGRTVQIVAAPYGTEANVVIKGRPVQEVFSNTAFLAVNDQANRNRIRVWRDHKPELACGRVTSLDPYNPAGLIAEFRLSNTRLGNETLELASDDVLDASVGFSVLEERWEGRSRRRVVKAWLHHLGLTSDPAYDGTHVLGVRGAHTH